MPEPSDPYRVMRYTPVSTEMLPHTSAFAIFSFRNTRELTVFATIAVAPVTGMIIEAEAYACSRSASGGGSGEITAITSAMKLPTNEAIATTASHTANL
jgi:hypothetical protein